MRFFWETCVFLLPPRTSSVKFYLVSFYGILSARKVLLITRPDVCLLVCEPGPVNLSRIGLWSACGGLAVASSQTLFSLSSPVGQGENGKQRVVY